MATFSTTHYDQMATQTYEKLQKQIADLEAQAAKLKTAEVAGVVSRIKEAIATYSLTPQDLFGNKLAVAKGKPKATKSSAAKYVDGKGGQWVGRGPRPKWLSEALAAGKQLEDFLAEKFKAAVETFSSPPAGVVAPVGKAGPKKTVRDAKKSKAAPSPGKTAASSAKYGDGAGNTWSGMGPTPKWLKEAVAGGKTKEDFLVKN